MFDDLRVGIITVISSCHHSTAIGALSCGAIWFSTPTWPMIPSVALESCIRNSQSTVNSDQILSSPIYVCVRSAISSLLSPSDCSMARITILLVFSIFVLYAQAVKKGRVCNQPGFAYTGPAINICQRFNAPIVDWDGASPTVSIRPAERDDNSKRRGMTGGT
jgi:hypothetical protein